MLAFKAGISGLINSSMSNSAILQLMIQMHGKSDRHVQFRSK
jgi:hypothetical protein